MTDISTDNEFYGCMSTHTRHPLSMMKVSKTKSSPSSMALERDGRSTSMMKHMHSGVRIPRTFSFMFEGQRYNQRCCK